MLCRTTTYLGWPFFANYSHDVGWVLNGPWFLAKRTCASQLKRLSYVHTWYVSFFFRLLGVCIPGYYLPVFFSFIFNFSKLCSLSCQGLCTYIALQAQVTQQNGNPEGRCWVVFLLVQQAYRTYRTYRTRTYTVSVSSKSTVPWYGNGTVSSGGHVFGT